MFEFVVSNLQLLGNSSTELLIIQPKLKKYTINVDILLFV